MNYNKELDKILEAREERTKLLKASLQNNSFVIVFSLNIPGLKKTGKLKKEFIKKYFFEYLNVISVKYDVQEYVFYEDGAGYQYFLTLKNGSPFDIKKISLKFENTIGANGALIDIDVYTGLFEKVSRENLAELPRKCFLCDDYAKVCSFKEKHSFEELNEFVQQKLRTPTTFVLSGEYIFQDILQNIKEGIIKPGDHLKEEILSKTYNVSRTKIREVVSKLVFNQVAVYKKNIGIVIRGFTTSELIEITELRMHLKVLIFNDIFEKIDEPEFKVVVEKILENLENIDKTNIEHMKM